jgi:hypothetical protein
MRNVKGREQKIEEKCTSTVNRKCTRTEEQEGKILDEIWHWILIK